MDDRHGYLRIGAFSERVGVSPELLRAWEKRYGLLTPDRSDGGFRLYSDDDVERVGRMLEHLARGASAAESAQLALTSSLSEAAREPANAHDGGAAAEQAPDGRSAVGDPATDAAPLEVLATRLREHLEAFDDAAAHADLDEALATFAVETALTAVVLPALVEIGARWESGTVTVAQEHFASGVLRGRLMSLAQGWGKGTGPRAVLATPPGEQHDLGLLIGGIALFRQGLRIVYLGADCPIATLVSAVETVRPAFVVLSAAQRGTFAGVTADLVIVSSRVPLFLAGAGASEEVAAEAGGTYVPGNPVRAAAVMARSAARTAGDRSGEQAQPSVTSTPAPATPSGWDQ